ncbi:MAG: response regulator transcription factor [Comamonadaceae bacterium]|nr:MAG: response regulator transcription factor [Comamonadaceae bacterium]
MHVLLIEDDLDLGPALQKSLRLEGISSEWRRRAEDAPSTLEDESFDCVLLDLSLPDGDGLGLLARWRYPSAQTSQVPVIIITARNALPDRLAGLDGGADDFLVKPFAPEELASRIRAVVRRCAQQASANASSNEATIRRTSVGCTSVLTTPACNRCHARS